MFQVQFVLPIREQRVSVDLLLVGPTANWTLDSVLIGDTQLNWVAGPCRAAPYKGGGGYECIRPRMVRTPPALPTDRGGADSDGKLRHRYLFFHSSPPSSSHHRHWQQFIATGEGNTYHYYRKSQADPIQRDLSR